MSLLVTLHESKSCYVPTLHTGKGLWASLLAQAVKKSACNVGDLGSIPGLGRSPGGGKGNLFQYTGLENFPWTEEPGRL